MSQDNRLLPLSPEPLDRPLRDLTQPPPVVAITHEPAHLREYLAVVLKRKWLILSLMVVVTSLVAIQMYRLPSIYEARTTIQIEQRQSNVLSTGRGGDLVIKSNDPTYWQTQLKKLETQKLARQVILRLDLHNNPAFLGANRGTGIIAALRRAAGGGPAPDKPEAEGAVPVVSDTELAADTVSPELSRRLEPFEDAFKENLTVAPMERTNLVEIVFKHTDPQIAQNVVNTIALVFRENDIREQTTGSQRAQDVLGKQIIDLQSRIQANEQRRLNYLRSNNLPLGSNTGQNPTVVRVAAYSAQLQDAERERKEKEAAFQQALRTRNSDGVWSIPEVQKDENVRRLREGISKLEQEKAALLVNYTEDWPAVQKINQQLKRLNAELALAPNEIVAGLKAQYEAAVQKERQISASYNSSRSEANAQSIDERGLKDIDQAIETDRQNLNLFTQRLNELGIQAPERASGSVIQVEEARLPRNPIGPQRARNIVIAFLLSLGVGVGLAFLLDYLDDTLKSVEDVDRHLHLPTLALIPAPREARRLLARSAGPAEPSDSTALTLIEDVRSPVAEAYRHLRTSLLLSSAGQPPKTILVTSSQPSEGKTTTVVNIAMMLAQTGADVLVLDCDLRRPRVHSHFGIANSRGVTNYLSGESNVSELVQDYKPLPNLKVMTSGPIPPNSAELLGSDEMRKLLYVLSENFTHIVIDSPPAISFTDASILSTMVDGVMLVVHGGRSSRAVVRRAKQQLQDVGAHIFGIVLNNVKLEGNDYYYYSGYYSGYYAGDEEGAPDGAEPAGAGPRPGAR